MQDLLWTLRIWISQIIGFQDCGPARGDLPLRADAQHGGLQQCGRVGEAGEDGSGGSARHDRTGGFVGGFQVHRLPQHRPERNPVVITAHNLHPLMVGVDVLHQFAKGVAAEEANGQPGGVGRQAQYVEIAAGIQIQFLTGPVFSQTLHDAAQGIRGDLLRKLRAKQCCKGAFLVIRLRALRPADHGGISDALHIVAVGQQVIERGGVSEGGVFSHRRIQALFLAIGAKRGGVERYNGRAAGLRARNALDEGMNRLRHIQPTCHQALNLLALAAAIVTVPCSLNGGILLDKPTVISEHQIGALHHVLPAVGQGGVEVCALRLPCVEIGKHGSRRGGIHIVQETMVQFGTGLKAFPASLRLALFVYTQQVAGIVPQEIRQHAGRAGDRCRELHLARAKHLLFAVLFLDEKGHCLGQAAVLRQTKRIADGRTAPAATGNGAPGGQILIQLRQRLQNHRTTS